MHACQQILRACENLILGLIKGGEILSTTASSRASIDMSNEHTGHKTLSNMTILRGWSHSCAFKSEDICVSTLYYGNEFIVSIVCVTMVKLYYTGNVQAERSQLCFQDARVRSCFPFAIN